VGGCRDTPPLQTGDDDHATHDVPYALNGLLDPEPADPDVLDKSAWQHVEPGIHSGFGSLDVVGVPPGSNIKIAIRAVQ
jgi:hypothetical protein